MFNRKYKFITNKRNKQYRLIIYIFLFMYKKNLKKAELKKNKKTT